MKTLVLLGEVTSALLHERVLLARLERDAVDCPGRAVDTNVPVELLLLFVARCTEYGGGVLFRRLGSLANMLEELLDRLNATSERPASDCECLTAAQIAGTILSAHELAVVLVRSQ